MFQKGFITATVCLVLANLVNSEYLTEKPSVLNPCNTNDPNFRKCFVSNFQVLFTDWKDGVPGLSRIGSLDPLGVKRVKVSHNAGPQLNLVAEMIDVVVKGTSHALIQDASFNPDKLSVHMKVFLPKLDFGFDYKLKGGVGPLNLDGIGKGQMSPEKILMHAHIQLKERVENGFTFTDIEKVKLQIQDINGFSIHLDNLFGGNKALEDSTNELFNSSWRQFYEILRPAIEQSMEAVLQDRFKKIFAFIPSDYFISDISTAIHH